MTTVAEAWWLIDTNVLLAATDESRPQHQESIRLVETAANLRTSAQVLREYLVVATRPVSANGLGLGLDDALGNLEAFRRSVRLLAEEKPVLPTFLTLLRKVQCRGKRIHDAHLVATAMLHGIAWLVTLNGKDFAPFAGQVATLTPAEARRRAGG